MTDKKTSVDVKTEKTEKTPAPAPDERWAPLASLRHEIDRLFDDFDPWRLPTVARETWPGAMRMLADWPPVPALDLSETEGGYEVTAELPGMDPKEVDITVSGGRLIIKGEKREETERKDKDRHISERRFGSFQRALRLPEDVDTDRIEASAANGVLVVRLPRSEKAKAAEKKIKVTSA